MMRFAKWLIVPAVLLGVSLVAAPQEAKAQGWGISFYGGSPYGYYGSPYGYRSYSSYSAFYGNPYTFRNSYYGGYPSYRSYYGGGHHHHHHHCR